MRAKRHPIEKCPFRYSDLVAAYYREAIVCLENHCDFAAIAVLWAAIEFAVEHQLHGGNLINPKTMKYMREPVDFEANRIKQKIEKFFELYPALRERWSKRLPELYELYRNTYLHAKLDNIFVSDLGESTVDGSLVGKNKLPRKKRTYAEVGLIAMAPQAAEQMFSDVKAFLTDLNPQVYPIARKLGGV